MADVDDATAVSSRSRNAWRLRSIRIAHWTAEPSFRCPGLRRGGNATRHECRFRKWNTGRYRQHRLLICSKHPDGHHRIVLHGRVLRQHPGRRQHSKLHLECRLSNCRLHWRRQQRPSAVRQAVLQWESGLHDRRELQRYEYVQPSPARVPLFRSASSAERYICDLPIRCQCECFGRLCAYQRCV